MATPAALKSINSLSGVDARLAALSKLEALSEELHAVESLRKSNKFLQRAVRAWRKGDFPRAGQMALAATNADESNHKAYHVLGMALERMGHLHKALVTYERAFQIEPEDPELLINLGLTAWNLKMTDGAARMFQLYIAACPDSPLGYNNLGSVLCDLGRPEDGIETLRAAIYRMPEESILWNSFATVLAEQGRSDESLVFYREAIRLDPGFARAYHNLGYAYQHLGDLEEALQGYDDALARAVDPTERRETEHSRSICLIGMGRLEDGFRNYEIRTHMQFRSYLHHVIEAPRWNGENIEGKKILLVGEQGLGDEFMFANILPDVYKAVGKSGKLQICVDQRLISLFQRSFPDADVGTYDDRTLQDANGNKSIRLIPFASGVNKPDLWAPMGSALQHYRKHIEDFPHQAFLTPNAGQVEDFRETLAKLGPEKKIGICWRSMMLEAKRAKYYSPIDAWGPVLQTPGVKFVSLQYGDSAAEIAHAKEVFGIDIHVMPDLDLRDDIDGTAALAKALDLVLSAPTAAAATAGSVGAKVWFITAGRTWPQLGTDEYPWYADTKVLSPEKFGDWQSLMPRLADDLAKFAAK